MNAREMAERALRRPGEAVRNSNAEAKYDGRELQFRIGDRLVGTVDVPSRSLLEFHITSRADANALEGVCEALGCSDDYHFSFANFAGYVTVRQHGQLIGVYPSGRLPWTPES